MSKRIYIVEDHPRLREVYSLFIAAASDLEVCGIAATAAQALDEIPTLNPDLVIIDISLPDLSGIELTRLLRAKYSALPILIVSGHAPGQMEAQITQAGANGYVDKKDAYVALLPAIQKLLNS